MNVVVALEGRFTLRNGRPASPGLTYEQIWKRYLDVFESVTVVARLFPHEDGSADSVEGPGVRFFALPPYTGPEQFLLKWNELRQRVQAACSPGSAFILRAPGNVSNMVWRRLRRMNHPYALEVVGDPYDVFAPGSVRHVLRPVFRRWMTRELRLQCAGAIGAAYVTEATLQRRYPCPAHMTSYSSVELPDEAFAGGPRPVAQRGRAARLATVGNVNQLYKAPHILLDAVARCTAAGWDLTLTHVGDGSYLPWLRQRARALGIGHRVEFAGRRPAGQAVRDVLDRADLFVMPSLTEGLPRAMIEAMARAVPCIGSTAGGIGELLPAQDLVPPGDPQALAEKILEVLRDPVRMAGMSARNLERAASYRRALLQQRRAAFYRLVRDRTRDHVCSGPVESEPRPPLDSAPALTGRGDMNAVLTSAACRGDRPGPGTAPVSETSCS